jgi:hypothetical protein
MGNYLSLTDSDLVTEISGYDFEDINPGDNAEKKFGIKNNKNRVVSNVWGRFWSWLKGGMIINEGGYALKSALVLRRDVNKNFQVTSVAKESADAVLTERTDREGLYRFNGTNYIETLTGDVALMSDSSHNIYIGFNEIYRAIKFVLDTAGEYEGLYFNIWDGTGWSDLPVDYTDGTAGFTQGGILFLGSVDQSLWKKCDTSGKIMYWLKIGCSGVTTTAIASVICPHGVFDFPKHFIFGAPSFYIKSSVPEYTPISSQVFTLCNMGRVVLNEDPRGVDEDLVSEYQYKNPQSDEYVITYTASNRCQVNGGPELIILPDGATPHYYIIPGMDLRFYPGITTAMTSRVIISKTLKYLHYALPNGGDPGTYQNSDILLSSSLSSLAVQGHYIKIAPPVDVELDQNTQGFNYYYHGV